MVRYTQGIQAMYAQLSPVMEMTRYEMDTFRFNIDFMEGSAHVVYGPTGTRKTSYCVSKYPEALFVRHMDDLKRYDRHQVIIFDDMSFSHLPRTAQIHLVDWDQPSSIHIRYGTAIIPRHILKIFTTNIRDIFSEDAAIDRRIKYHHVA
ncbi:MAG: replication protein [Circoviridae sp.]|nr:MAG: replication protein [Circoviridae sp.]